MSMALTKTDNKVKLLTVSGLFAALIYIVTAYIHFPSGVGYVHPGDGLIYLAACILPLPYAAAASAIGGALADGLTNYAVWIPATIVIKAVTALFFSNKQEKIISVRNIIGIIPSLILCIVGYSLYEGIVMSDSVSKAAIAAAFGQTPFYCVQVGISTVLFVALGLAFDRIKLKKQLGFAG